MVFFSDNPNVSFAIMSLLMLVCMFYYVRVCVDSVILRHNLFFNFVCGESIEVVLRLNGCLTFIHLYCPSNLIIKV